MSDRWILLSVCTLFGTRFRLSVARQWIYNFHVSTHLPLNIKCNIYRIDESIQQSILANMVWFSNLSISKQSRCCSFFVIHTIQERYCFRLRRTLFVFIIKLTQKVNLATVCFISLSCTLPLRSSRHPHTGIIYSIFYRCFCRIRRYNFLSNFLLFCLNFAFDLISMRNIDSVWALCNAMSMRAVRVSESEGERKRGGGERGE